MLRDLASCPARARDVAYGGDPGLDRPRLALTARRLRRLAPGARDVFEVGYGSGALLRRFAAAGARVGGIDAGQLGVPGTFLVGELESLEPDPDWDLVYGTHVLEHLRDPAAGLRAAYGLLRPGGTLALVTPTTDSLGPALFGSAWWLLEDPTHVRFFTPASARRALETAGFTGVRVRRLLLDTLTIEVASARRLRKAARPRGVLAERPTIAAALAAAPLTVAARAVLPRLRPSLEVTARKPG